MKIQTENPVQVNKKSNLSHQNQQNLVKLVLQEGVDAWKKASESLGLKSSKEAIFEFLRIEDQTILEANKYMIDNAIDLAAKAEPSIAQKSQDEFSESEPLDQVDHLLL